MARKGSWQKKWRKVHINGQEWRYRKGSSYRGDRMVIVSPDGTTYNPERYQIAGCHSNEWGGWPTDALNPSKVKHYIVEWILGDVRYIFRAGEQVFVEGSGLPGVWMISRARAPEGPYAMVYPPKPANIYRPHVIHQSRLRHACPLMALAACAE